MERPLCLLWVCVHVLPAEIIVQSRPHTHTHTRTDPHNSWMEEHMHSTGWMAHSSGRCSKATRFRRFQFTGSNRAPLLLPLHVSAYSTLSLVAIRRYLSIEPRSECTASRLSVLCNGFCAEFCRLTFITFRNIFVLLMQLLLLFMETK